MTVSPTFIEELKKIIDAECLSVTLLPDDYTVARLVQEKGIGRERAVRILNDLEKKGYFVKLRGHNPENGKRILIYRPVEPEKKGRK